MHRTPKNENREVKGMTIMSLESSIKRINKLHYKVKSQSSTSEKEKWYDIVKKYGHNKGGLQKGEWICTCPDFIYRHIICKHIYASYIFETTSKENSFPRCCSVVNTYT
jgi:hypothetical protein